MKLLFFGLIVLAVRTALYFYGGRLLTGSADRSISARNVADVHDMVVDLEIDTNTRLLFIVLGADGSINRSGSGTLKNKNIDLFIGITDPAIFKMVRIAFDGCNSAWVVASGARMFVAHRAN